MRWNNVRTFLLVTLISLVGLVLLVVLFAWWSDASLLDRVVEKYNGDSFHTLGYWQRIGLVALTAVALLTVAALSWCLTVYLQRWQAYPIAVVAPLDILFTVVFYWLILSAAPQLFYVYYWNIIPGLPVQWVLKAFIPLAEFLSLFKLSYTDSLSDHTAGAAGWVLLLNKTQQWFRFRLVTRSPVS